MKNIHLIPTDKPSRLYSKDGRHILDTTMAIDWYISSACYKPQNIYITSDEEIKEGDWVICSMSNKPTKALQNEVYSSKNDWRKIVLTTDPELINDGVQGIDDEFLNWYVNNPGCDYVKVEVTEISCIIPNFGDVDKYRIVIPKEEPKQTDENGKPLTYWGGLAEHKQNTNLDGDGLGGIPKGILTMLIGEKEETLEQAAECTVLNNSDMRASYSMGEFGEEMFKRGAKWQAKEMYSEQEAFNLIMDFFMEKDSKYTANPVMVADWFEKNKKK